MYKDCPSDELEICWWYEYAREAIRGSPVKGSLFPSDPFLSERFSLPELFPEWPDKPYLLIPGPERDRRLQRLAGGTSNYLHLLNLKPPFQSHPGLKLAPGRRELRRLRYRWPISEIDPRSLLALFRIDWERSDQEVLDDVAAWLKVYRPKEYPSRVHNKTGAGAVPRQLKAELRALGALRLLRHYKSRQTIIPEEAAALYTGQASWGKAQRKAESRLELFKL